MGQKINFDQAIRLLKRAKIKHIGNLNKIELFVIPPNGRLLGVFDNSILSNELADLTNLLGSGCILIPLGQKESFIEALIGSLGIDEHQIVDLLVIE
jgi:hypothetical protein